MNSISFTKTKSLKKQNLKNDNYENNYEKSMAYVIYSFWNN